MRPTLRHFMNASVVLAALLSLAACSGDRSPTTPAAAPRVAGAVVSASDVSGVWSGSLQLTPTFSRPIMLILTQGSGGLVTGWFAQYVGRWAYGTLTGHYDGLSKFVGSVGPYSVVFTVSADGHTATGLDMGLYPFTVTR